MLLILLFDNALFGREGGGCCWVLVVVAGGLLSSPPVEGDRRIREFWVPSDRFVIEGVRCRSRTEDEREGGLLQYQK